MGAVSFEASMSEIEGDRPAQVGVLLRQAQALVFDFDGTLVDSNPVKREAFARCFQNFPHRDQILAYCWGNHHIPRDEKFRYVYERLLGQDYTPEIAAQLHARFEALTTEAVIEAPEIPGASEFLRRMTGPPHALALLSSTPEPILRHIVTARGWADYFSTIQGSPVEKAAWLQTHRQRLGAGPRGVVMFGDTIEDAAAAAQAQCPFIGVRLASSMTPVECLVPDFHALLALIARDPV